MMIHEISHYCYSSSTYLKRAALHTWYSNGPFLALKSCTGQRCFAQTCHVHSADLELVEDILLEALSLETANEARMN